MKLVRNVLVAAVLATAGGAVVAAGPAQAIPVVGPNESVTITYYSNSSRTVVVGEWSYGYCGEPFQWGSKTGYSSYVKITC